MNPPLPQRSTATGKYQASLFWTPARVEELEALNAEAVWSASQIGAKLGCTRNMVIGKLRRLHVSLSPAYVPHLSKPRKTRQGARSRPTTQSLNTPPVIGDQPVELAAEPPSTSWVRFADLGPIVSRQHCRWPVEGAPGPDMWCCGATRISENHPYCVFHWSLATGRSREVR